MRATFWRYIFPTLISFMSSAINGVIDAAIVGHLVGPSGIVGYQYVHADQLCDDIAALGYLCGSLDGDIARYCQG